MERIQTDMRHSPYGDFNYIGHFEDHMTKFHILFPIRDKSVNEGTTIIEERVLAYVGTPHIFHSDNSREFVHQLLHSLLISGAEQHIVMEEEITEMTQPFQVPVFHPLQVLQAVPVLVYLLFHLLLLLK